MLNMLDLGVKMSFPTPQNLSNAEIFAVRGWVS